MDTLDRPDALDCEDFVQGLISGAEKRRRFGVGARQQVGRHRVGGSGAVGVDTTCFNHRPQAANLLIE